MAPASIKECGFKANYTVWIHSETRTWHGNNIQLIQVYTLCELGGYFVRKYERWFPISSIVAH